MAKWIKKGKFQRKQFSPNVRAVIRDNRPPGEFGANYSVWIEEKGGDALLPHSPPPRKGRFERVTAQFADSLTEAKRKADRTARGFVNSRKKMGLPP